MKLICALLLALGWAPVSAGAEQSHLLIVAGLSGDPEHAEVFHQWAVRLVDAAKERYGLADENVVYLGEDPKVDPARIDGRASREEITKALGALARRAAADDPVLIMLIGHGSSGARFNLPGPDMSAAEFARLLQPIRSRRLAFVNAASASGSFVSPLAAPGRVVVTATRREAEQYATLFGGFFIEALAGDAADMDKDQRVSFLEAFNYARRTVEEAYKREGLLATEHALLDDNGDGEASAEPGPNAADGPLAASIRLGVGAARTAGVAADPALRALYSERDELEARVAALKLLKASMDPARYAKELEQLLTELALKSRVIREKEAKP